MQFKDITLPSNKRFGLFFSVIFALSFLYLFEKKFEVLNFLFSILSALFLIISFTKPKILLPLNKSWMFFGFIIGKAQASKFHDFWAFGPLDPHISSFYYARNTSRIIRCLWKHVRKIFFSCQYFSFENIKIRTYWKIYVPFW